MTQKDEPRRCYYIPPGQCDEHGFIPSLVIEHEAGHSPMTGRGDCAVPWYWGKTYENAEQTCDRVNKARFGITPQTAAAIVTSSMAAQNRERGGLNGNI